MLSLLWLFRRIYPLTNCAHKGYWKQFLGLNMFLLSTVGGESPKLWQVAIVTLMFLLLVTVCFGWMYSENVNTFRHRLMAQ